MFFHTQHYLIFFVVVFTLYWAARRSELRVWLLVGASIVFYAVWSQALAFLVLSSTVMDYLLARKMDSSQSPLWRRIYLGTSLCVNLGILCYFKYADFFISSLVESLRLVGGDLAIPALNLMVPFGISFYTFEAISYTMDVYHHRIAAEKKLSHFLLFILFFPHLVAGPIVRARDFLFQVNRPKRFSWPRLQLGLEYFLLGLFKKMVLADTMAIYSDVVFAPGSDIASLKTQTIWIGVLAFALRIYCDFSGYSDMALGSAHMLGYKLAINFRLPYLARNISDFWHRWHISLSTWLRDYLFIPLGGSRCSRGKTARNLLITMGLGGLWHGASGSFIVWGLFHGSLLIIHRRFRDFMKSYPQASLLLETWPGIIARTALTFFCVCLGWIFFQPSLDKSLAILHRMFLPDSAGHVLAGLRERFLVLAAVLVAGHLVVSSGWWPKLARRLPAQALGAMYASFFCASLLLSPDATRTFIYFTF